MVHNKSIKLERREYKLACLCTSKVVGLCLFMLFAVLNLEIFDNTPFCPCSSYSCRFALSEIVYNAQSIPNNVKCTTMFL